METIEQKSLEIVTRVVSEWTVILEGYGCNVGQIELNNNGDKDNYFSEIEAYVWKNSSIVTVLNLVLFLDGKQTMTYDELEIEINDQIRELFNKLSS